MCEFKLDIYLIVKIHVRVKTTETKQLIKKSMLNSFNIEIRINFNVLLIQWACLCLRVRSPRGPCKKPVENIVNLLVNT